LSASSRGRSRGVIVPFVQIPCRSGCPSGIRGTPERVWPVAVNGAIQTNAAATMVRNAVAMEGSCVRSPRLSTFTYRRKRKGAGGERESLCRTSKIDTQRRSGSKDWPDGLNNVRNESNSLLPGGRP
jgi:hypothetical protein